MLHNAVASDSCSPQNDLSPVTPAPAEHSRATIDTWQRSFSSIPITIKLARLEPQQIPPPPPLCCLSLTDITEADEQLVEKQLVPPYSSTFAKEKLAAQTQSTVPCTPTPLYIRPFHSEMISALKARSICVTRPTEMSLYKYKKLIRTLHTAVDASPQEPERVGVPCDDTMTTVNILPCFEQSFQQPFISLQDTQHAKRTLQVPPPRQLNFSPSWADTTLLLARIHALDNAIVTHFATWADTTLLLARIDALANAIATNFATSLPTAANIDHSTDVATPQCTKTCSTTDGCVRGTEHTLEGVYDRARASAPSVTTVSESASRQW